MISPEDMYLFRLTDDVGAAVAEITRFYRVYHSQRYVGDDLILRLNRPVSPVTLERINDEFAARILTGGRIETCPPPAEEGGECPEKPRLRMRFDKKSFGLLRRLIDTLNSDPDPPAPPQAVE